MQTRRELIVERYNSLCAQVKLLTPDEFFPSLEDIDPADLVYFITLTFLGCTDDLERQVRLREILETHRIQLDNETFAQMYPIVNDFLDFVKNL